MTLFTDLVGSPPATKFQATVLWRGGGHVPARRMTLVPVGSLFAGLARWRGTRWMWYAWMYGRFVVPMMFRFRIPFLLIRLTPRRYRAAAIARLMPDVANRSPGSGWAGASSGVGEDQREVRFSRALNVVRIRGRDFNAPSDAMLVLLVEDDPGAAARIRVVERSIPMPLVDYTFVDRGQSKEAQIASRREQREKEQALWRDALDGDPIVADFLAQCAADAH